MLIFVRRRSHLDMGPGTYSTRLAIDARHLKTGTGTYTRNLIIGLKELQFGPLHMAAHGAAHIFTVSEYSKRRLIEYLDIDPTKLRLSITGSAISTVLKIRSAHMKLLHPVSISRFLILYVGSLKPHKNLETLIM